MAWAALPGAPLVPIGPGLNAPLTVPAAGNAATIDAANEAVIYIGHMLTSDGGSHTIDTIGSSSIGWAVGTAATFANGGTTVKVGLAAVDTGAGPPARAAHASDVITFDVHAALTGGGGGITANTWSTSVPTAGTKTVAHGDLVAVAIQMTARGGADSVDIRAMAATSAIQRPLVTSFTGGSYAATVHTPNVMVTFSDGALGYFQGGEALASTATRTWNSGSATKEYGQLVQYPFPVKVYGMYGWVDPDNNFDLVLYSDPLGGSPVAEKTVAIDANVVGFNTGRKFEISFDTPYFADAYEKLGVVFKPGASNISAYYKTLASATHRVVDPWGTSGYGISRASGAFADANSSLDHYYIGLIVGAFESGVYPGYQLGSF